MQSVVVALGVFSMKLRSAALVAILAIVVGACGAGPDPSAQGTADARALAYSLTGDTVMTYHTEMDTSATTTFDAGATSLGSSVPGSMDMKMGMSFDSTYRIGDGPEAGSYRVALTTDNIELSAGSIKMGDQTMDLSDLPQSDLDAALNSELPEFVYIINDKGEVVSVEADGVSIDVSGLLGGVSTGGFTSGQMFGPQLPDGEVNIGDTWTTSSQQQFGDVVVITEQKNEILRQEDYNGHRTWVIKTEASTEGYTITWDDIVAVFEAMGGVDQVEGLQDLPPAFQMAMHAAPSGSTMITWLDPESGRAVAVDNTTSMVTTMEMGGIPGMAGSFTMHVDGNTHMRMELAD
jgi:hypothetical protein